MANDFSENELEALGELVAQYLELDDLNQREWAEARALLDKIEHRVEMLNGALDPHDKFFR